MTFDATTITALGAALAAVITALAAYANSRRKNSDVEDKDLKRKYIRLRRYVSNKLYPAALRLHAQVVRLGDTPVEDVPEEDVTVR